ncbi:MAG: polyprenyl synthetase family protein [Candidatus Moranbacteria bacterium]|nr:polyprenyl synthetase family protein [Candidatus Moranbacteria bacterium]
MDVSLELSLFKKKIDKEITRFLDKEIYSIQKKDTLVVEALRHTKNIILSGGKRIRSAMMYHGHLLSGGEDNEEILRACVSMELIHAFLLIHDDVMDRDNFRHGKKTLHTFYSEYAQKFFSHKDCAHFGNTIAISLGDMFAALGQQCLYESNFSPERIVFGLRFLQSVVSSTIIGQVKDIRMGFSSHVTEEAEVLVMYENKTARYTFEGPLCLGSILAGKKEDFLGYISSYAIPTGIAYQIQDDILGIYGNPTTIGKPIGSDLEEGKMTILISKAYELGNKTQKKNLMDILGAPLNKKNLSLAKEIIEETGSLAYARSLNSRLLQEGEEAIKKISLKNNNSMDFLIAVSSFLSQRTV